MSNIYKDHGKQKAKNKVLLKEIIHNILELLELVMQKQKLSNLNFRDINSQ